MKCTWKTRLLADECLRRLREQTARRPLFLFRMPSKETIYCRVSGSRFRLFALLPDSMHNTGMPFFSGSVKAAPDGSVIRGRLGMHPLQIAIAAYYFTGVVAMFVFLVWVAVTGAGTPRESYLTLAMAILLTVVFTTAGIIVITCGVIAGRAQRETILHFLDTILEATHTGQKAANQRMQRVE